MQKPKKGKSIIHKYQFDKKHVIKKNYLSTAKTKMWDQIDSCFKTFALFHHELPFQPVLNA